MNGNARLRILLNSLSLQPRHGVMILLLRIKPIKLTILNRVHTVTPYSSILYSVDTSCRVMFIFLFEDTWSMHAQSHIFSQMNKNIYFNIFIKQFCKFINVFFHYYPLQRVNKVDTIFHRFLPHIIHIVQFCQ